MLTFQFKGRVIFSVGHSVVDFEPALNQILIIFVLFYINTRPKSTKEDNVTVPKMISNSIIFFLSKKCIWLLEVSLMWCWWTYPPVCERNVSTDYGQNIHQPNKKSFIERINTGTVEHFLLMLFTLICRQKLKTKSGSESGGSFTIYFKKQGGTMCGLTGILILSTHSRKSAVLSMKVTIVRIRMKYWDIIPD